MQFRKKPVVIEAILASEVLDGATAGRFSAKYPGECLPPWIIEAFEKAVIGFESGAGQEVVLINTLEGQMRAGRTDWIIKGVKGELYPCKADIFAATYERANIIPKVLDCIHGRPGGEMCPHCFIGQPIHIPSTTTFEPAHAGRWEVYRCKDAGPTEACGIRTNDRGEVHDMIVSDTNREECCHHMRLDDAMHIVELHNESLLPLHTIRVQGDISKEQFAEFKKKWMEDVKRIGERPAHALIIDATGTRNDRQAQVAKWAVECFGEVETLSVPQRALRLLEESVELAQAAHINTAFVHKLVDFVYDRPIGDVKQEIGGVSVCLLALAHAVGESADELECAEVERVLAKPHEFFSQRNAAKNAAGFKVF